MSRERLLSLDVSVDYAGKPGVLRNVSLEVNRGEIVGLVGQSGSGKSTLAMAILRLLELKGGSARGQIRFEGRDLMTLSERELRRIRGKQIGLVLQSPMTALNPALRIGTQLKEGWRCHGGDPAGWRRRAMELGEREPACGRGFPPALSPAAQRRAGAAGLDRHGDPASPAAPAGG